MRDLSLFLAQDCPLPENKKIMISHRFQDEEGHEILWEIRAITEKENMLIRMSEGIEEKPEEYWGKLCAACVVFPNIKDVQLMKSYDCVSPDIALKKMLTIGEYMILLKEVRELNCFSEREKVWKNEAKN